MSIMEYNGSAIVAMVGKGCVAIAADTRYGVRQLQTMNCQRQKTFKMTDQCYVGLSGLATDVQTLSATLDFNIKLYELKEERQMEPKIVANLLSHMLYEKRFGPWFSEPVVAGLDKDGKPYICAFDMIGACSCAEDFAVGGTASEQLYGTCETFWKADMNEDELFETISQCLLSAVDRDCLSGWGGEVHVITKDKITTRKLKGRMD